MKDKSTDAFRYLQDEKNGSVTVFLSLILVLLISVFTLSLESAHMAAVRSHAAMKSNAVMDSLLSMYEKGLYEDFQILALNSRVKPADVLKNSLDNYDDPDSLLTLGTNFLQSDTDTVTVSSSNITYLTDDDCAGFQEEINEIVAADAAEIVQKEITSYLSGTGSVSKMTEIADKVLENSSDVAGLAKKLTDLYKQVQAINKSRDALQKEMLELLEELDIYDSDAEKDTWNNVKIEWVKVTELKSSLTKAYKTLGTNLQSYITDADKLNGVFQDIIKDLKASDIEEEYKNEIVKSFEGISSMLDKNGYVYEGIVQAIKDTASGKNTLENIEIPEWVKVKTEDTASKELREIIENARKKTGELALLKIDKLEESESSSSSLSASGLLSGVKKLIKNGTFSLFVDNIDELSSRKISMSEYPSSKCKNALTQIRSMIADADVSQGIDTCTLDFYLYEYLDCYTDGDQYDLEYVLGSKKTDKENLKSVLDQLVLVRQAANCIYLFGDSGKKEEARAAATALFAVTGNALIIEAFTIVILAAWAYAEGVLDVRKLLAGDSVPFFKNAENFQLSLSAAVSGSSWMTSSGTGKKQTESAENAFEAVSGMGKSKTVSAIQSRIRSGLRYKDYLLILLFFHLPGTNRYRALDMIQWNMQQEDSGFKISQCIYSLKANFTFSANPVFVKKGKYDGHTMPGSFQFTHTEEMSYGAG